MSIHSLAVFCGSKSGNDPVYIQHAAELGKLLAKYHITLIYGGGGTGIMKAIADNVMENGGKVVGVIPKMLIEWEHQHKNISELIITDDMHARKKTIYSKCDAALVLPGGLGTLDELFEMLTWNQLSIHDKKIFILNSGGFFDHLIQHILRLEKNGFLYEPAEKRLKFLNEPAELLQYLQ
ncbi:MAG: TIGR00730 family Rossman fold protein [Chitinophagales bacterium]